MVAQLSGGQVLLVPRAAQLSWWHASGGAPWFPGRNRRFPATDPRRRRGGRATDGTPGAAPHATDGAFGQDAPQLSRLPEVVESKWRSAPSETGHTPSNLQRCPLRFACLASFEPLVGTLSPGVDGDGDFRPRCGLVAPRPGLRVGLAVALSVGVGADSCGAVTDSARLGFGSDLRRGYSRVAVGAKVARASRRPSSAWRPGSSRIGRPSSALRPLPGASRVARDSAGGGASVGPHLAARCRVSEFGVVGLRAESFGHVRPVGRAAPSDVNSLGEFPAHVAPSAPPPVPVVKTIGREGEKGMRGRRKYTRYGNPRRRARHFSRNNDEVRGRNEAPETKRTQGNTENLFREIRWSQFGAKSVGSTENGNIFFGRPRLQTPSGYVCFFAFGPFLLFACEGGESSRLCWAGLLLSFFGRVVLVDPGRIDPEPSFLLSPNGAREPGTAQRAKNGSARRRATSGL